MDVGFPLVGLLAGALRPRHHFTAAHGGLQKRSTPEDGAFAHVERRIKRVQRAAGGAWLLISDNPRYEKELIKPEDMKDV